MSLATKKKALLDCGCGCGGRCIIPCCPDFVLEDAQLENWGFEPGSLGCPDIGEGCVGGDCTAPYVWRMTVGSPSVWGELFEGDDICVIWASEGYFNVGGLIGTIEFEVVVGCLNSGGEFRAFIRYVNYPLAPFPLDTWIEVEAGWDCPDCSDPGLYPDGTYAYLWFEVFFDCTVCRAADYDYDTESCVSSTSESGPGTIFSIRYNFRGFGYCE